MRKFLLIASGLLLLSLHIIAQGLITGKITNAKDGTPLAGASVTIRKGGSVVSSSDGTFSITGKKNEEIVAITSVGFFDTTFTARAGSTIEVALKEDIRTLNEVVVTGVGVATSRKKLGISVESVTAEKLPPTPTASIDQALVGKIPGAQISSVNGTPGKPANILFRGINTLQRGTQPLVLVDGIEVGATDLNSLDLSNVERIEVIQGAASATIYGAQGANGVIQIFTKKGRQGALSINFSTSGSLNQYINSGDVHAAHLHSWRTDANNNIVDAGGNILKVQDDGTITGLAWAYPAGNGNPSAMSNPLNIGNKPYDKNFQYYDHLKQLFKDAYTTNNSLSISGGQGKSDFALTLSNNRQESNIRKNGSLTRTNFTANVGTELFKGFTLRSVTQLVSTRSTLNPNFAEGSSHNAIYGALNTSPFIDFNHTLADGTYPSYLTAGTVSVNSTNPNYVFEYSSGNDTKVDIIQNFQANYKVNRFVNLDAKYGINYRKQDINNIYQNQSGNINSNSQQSWTSGKFPDISSLNGNFIDGNSNDNTGEIDNLTYTTTFQNLLLSAYIKTDFQKDFNINVPITTNTQVSFDYRKNKYQQYFTYGYSLPTYPIYNMNQTASQSVVPKVGDYVEPFVTYGYLVNQKFDFGEYGGISAGFRSDYSSAFGQGSKPFTFPRGDAYFRPSSLNFWKDGNLGNILPEVKFRAAYGEAGIQPRPFDRYITLNPGNVGTNLAFSLPTVQSNPNLKVEVSKELEIGTDINISGSKGRWFHNFNIGVTYWKRKGENIIYPINLSPSTGANSIKDNSINLSSHGLQASLNINVLKSRDFTWDFTTNISNQTSVIDRINAAVPEVITNTSAGDAALVLRAGQKIGQIFGYKAFKSLDERKLDGTPYIDKADYGKYQMVNGYVVDTATKGIQFTNQAYSFGDPNPRFNASFINSFTYKEFLFFSFQFDWINGSHLYNQTKEWMYRDGISGDYDVPVTINGQTAAYTAYYRSAYADYFGARNAARNGTKDYFYEDASFLRLRNISIGFDLARFTSIKHVNRLQLVLTGRNIWTVTNYTGLDPEISSGTSNSAFDRGVDHSSMPNIKSYQVGINVGF